MYLLKRSVCAVLLGVVAALAQAWEHRPVVPEWTRAVHLKDGRVFVSDRNIILDAAFAKPAAVPTQVVDPTWLQAFLGTTQPSELPVSRFRKSTQGKTPVYVAPTGLMLSAAYVEYLEHLFRSSALRFRCNGPLDPVLIVVDGAAVGAVMPMAP